MPENVKDGVVFAQPTTWEARSGAAQQCRVRLDITMTTVVDDMDDPVDNLYAGWPERMYIISRDGKIAYAGGRGPWGFRVDEVEAWLRQNIGEPAS